MPVRKEINPFDRIVWFERRIAFEIDYFELLQPRREVSHGLRYKSGLYRSEKCGREIQYESSLELHFVLEHHAYVRFFWDQPVRFPTGEAVARYSTPWTTASISIRTTSY